MSIDTGFDKWGMFGFWANRLAARSNTPSSAESKEADRERDVSAVALPAIRQERRDRSPDLRLHVDVFVNRGDDREPRSARAEREAAVKRYEDPTPHFDLESLSAPYGTTLINNFCQKNNIAQAIEVMKTLREKGLLNNIHVNRFLEASYRKDFTKENLLDLNYLISKVVIGIQTDNIEKWIRVHFSLNIPMDNCLSSHSGIGQIRNPLKMLDIFNMLNVEDNRAYRRETSTKQYVVRSAADTCFKAWLQKASLDALGNELVLASYFKIRRSGLVVVKSLFRDVYNKTYGENPERARLLLRLMLSGEINGKSINWGEPFTSHLNRLLKSDELSALPEGDL